MVAGQSKDIVKHATGRFLIHADRKFSDEFQDS